MGGGMGTGSTVPGAWGDSNGDGELVAVLGVECCDFGAMRGIGIDFNVGKLGRAAHVFAQIETRRSESAVRSPSDPTKPPPSRSSETRLPVAISDQAAGKRKVRS